MIDFSRFLGDDENQKKLNPLEIYESLDRASDKGPLRPVQSVVLTDWFTDYQDAKDVIIKLHTGQGKTLIGLLILQSRLNRTGQPALYLCPNRLLAEQTCEQAKQFGIKYCQVYIPFMMTQGSGMLAHLRSRQ